MKKIITLIIVITLIMPFLIAPLSYANENLVKENQIESEENIIDKKTQEENNDTENNLQKYEEDDDENTEKANNVNDNVRTENEEQTQAEGVEKIQQQNQIEIETDKIEEGTYYIKSSINEGMVFDIDGSSQANGAKLQLWGKSPNDTDNQKFIITYNEEGCYEIEVKHSGKALEEVGTGIQQNDKNDNDTQKWIIKEAGEGYYYIISKCNGLYIDVAGGIAQDGSTVQMSTENGSNAQKFKFEKIEDKVDIVEEKTIEEGTYYIESSINEGMVFDIDGSSQANGAKLQLWGKSPNDTDNQKFIIKYNEEGYYEIEVKHSGKALEEVETGIQQNDKNNNDTQKWIIKEAGEGYYYIISKCNGLYIDVASGVAQDGSTVQMSTENGSNAQKFKFEKIEDKVDIVGEKTIEEGTYYIESSINEGMVFDIDGSSQANGAKLQLWGKSPNNTDNQKYIVTYNEEGYYEIEVKHSGKALEKVGTGIQQNDKNDNDTQKWIIKEAGGGYYYIISKNNGLYIDVAGGIAQDGSTVQMYEGNGSNAQKFKFEKIEDKVDIVGEKTIEEGTYYIESSINEGMVFDIDGSSQANGAKLQLWGKSPNNTDNQKYIVAYNEEGYYEIEVKHSGKALEEVGTGIQQNDKNNNDTQKWIIKEAGEGYYYIISKNNGLYIDVVGGVAQDGSTVQMSTENGSNAQKFKFEKIEDKVDIVGEKTIEDGIYKIKVASNEGLGLDVESSSKLNQANVQIWGQSGLIAKNQRFEVTYNEEGYYTIKATHSGKVIEVAGAGMTNGTNVQQYEANGTKAQQWIIKENEDGTYSIISRLNGLYLDIQNGNIKEGNNVDIYEGNGTDAQKFKFEKVKETKSEKLIENGVYKISTALNGNMVFDIAEGSYDNNANLQLWGSTNSQQQKFGLTYNEEGYYEIKSVNSGKMLNVTGNSNDDGANVEQYESNGTEYQKWILQDAGNGYYYIASKGAELYLDVAGDKGQDGANIQIYGADGSLSQMFKFEEVPIINTGSIYNVVTNVDESKVLDIDLNSSNLQIWTLNEQSNNQKFILRYLEDGYYKIVCKETGEVLTVDGTNVIQSKDDDADFQKWKIEIAGFGYYYIISKSTGLYLDITGGSSAEGTNVEVYENNGSKSQKFKFLIAKGDVSNFESLDESKYPGYKEALRKLQNQHPNWIITIDYTGLDWNTVLNNEDVLVTGKDGNVSARSLTQYTNEWRSTDSAEYTHEPGWYRASRAAIAYMMDPRNSLDDEYVFQFQDLTSSAGTYSDIAKMIEGTYITEYEEKGVTTTDSIINTILSSATTYNISPFHLVSRMIQEQGTGGTPLSDGYVYGGRTVYNLFNIQAVGGSNEEIWQNGAAYAYNHHWTSPELCINGSAAFLYNDYLSQGQTTLYYQKYDVVQEPYYTHQYMTNIRGANDEGQRVAKEYKANGMIDSQFEFTIPVYENMPQEPCPRPNGTTPW